LQAWWSTPVLLIYFLIRALGTGGCVCRGHN